MRQYRISSANGGGAKAMCFGCVVPGPRWPEERNLTMDAIRNDPKSTMVTTVTISVECHDLSESLLSEWVKVYGA